MQPTAANARGTHLTVNLERLDALKDAHGIRSDVELAKRLDVHLTTLLRVRSGQSKASAEFLGKIADAFPNASLDALFRVERGSDA